MAAVRFAALVAVIGLCSGCQREPLLATQGFAFGSRLDAIFVVRGDKVIAVGDEDGKNTSGAFFTERLLNAYGEPLGGQAVPVAVYELLGQTGGSSICQGGDASPLDDGGGRRADGGAATDAGSSTDGGAGDGGVVDGGAANDDASAVIDASTLADASAAIDGAADLSAPEGGTVTPAAPESPFITTATADVTLGDWIMANIEVRGTPVGDNHYDVRLIAKKLIPNGLYSVWLQYVDAVPNPRLFAIAPLGGLPNFFIADQNGEADVTFRASNQYFEVFNAIPDAVRVGASDTPPVLTPTTGIIVSLNYHSNGQTNGNASLLAPGPTDVDIPAGDIAIMGHVGVDVHPQVSSIPMPAVPRPDP